MKSIDPRTLDFFDRYVTRLIVEKYGLDEMKAIRGFIDSETYQMLIEPELELYKMSPHVLFDMWESEQITGDPRNSLYIRGDEVE
jgi:hypothetical protein